MRTATLTGHRANGRLLVYISTRRAWRFALKLRRLAPPAGIEPATPELGPLDSTAELRGRIYLRRHRMELEHSVQVSHFSQPSPRGSGSFV